MERKFVKDLMISVDNYATINHNASLYDAISELEKSKKTAPDDINPIRSVIVMDDKGKIVGKIGHIGILKALEPKYNLAENDLQKFAGMNFDASIIKTIMDKHKLWSANLPELLKEAKNIAIKDVMDPITARISYDAPLVEAIHKLISYQVLALLVRKEDDIIGIIRLSDIYGEIVSGLQSIFKVIF